LVDASGSVDKVITGDTINSNGYSVIAPVLTIPRAHKIVTAPDAESSTGFVRVSQLSELFFPDI